MTPNGTWYNFSLNFLTLYSFENNNVIVNHNRISVCALAKFPSTPQRDWPEIRQPNLELGPCLACVVAKSPYYGNCRESLPVVIAVRSWSSQSLASHRTTPVSLNRPVIMKEASFPLKHRSNSHKNQCN